MRRSTPSAEQLRNIRIPCVQRVRLTHPDGATEEAFVVDLGLRGVFVEREQPLAEGTPVEVEFRLPGNEIPVRARCRVAWWNPPEEEFVTRRLPAGLGLAFTELPEFDRARIEAMVGEHLRGGRGLRRFHRQWPAPGGQTIEQP